MDKKTIAIIGIGVIGATALILMRSAPTYQPGGFAGGPSKKEGAVTETVTETPGGDPIYNIFFPDPSFPSLPEAPISEPWWVTSMDEPYEPSRQSYVIAGAKKQEVDLSKTLMARFMPETVRHVQKIKRRTTAVSPLERRVTGARKRVSEVKAETKKEVAVKKEIPVFRNVLMNRLFGGE